MSARSDENGIHVVVGFYETFTTFFALGDGDTLTATVGGVTRTLERTPTEANQNHYEAMFAADDSATSIVISLHRTNGQPDAPNSVIPIAPAFSIAAPPSVAWRTDTPLGVWFPIQVVTRARIDGNTFKLRVRGPCAGSEANAVDQPVVSNGDGTVSVEINRLLQPDAHDCDTSLELREETTGKLDPVFKGYLVPLDGVQARVAHTTWNPSATGGP
jgi:hypothetical protein